VDPSGLLTRHSFLEPGDLQYQAGKLTLAYWIDGSIDRRWDFNDINEFYTWGSQDDILNDIRNQNPAGWELSGGDATIFLAIKALEFMYVFSSIEISMIENEGWTIFNNSQRERDFVVLQTVTGEPASIGIPERNFSEREGLKHVTGIIFLLWLVWLTKWGTLGILFIKARLLRNQP